MQKKPGIGVVQVNIARTFVRIFRAEIEAGITSGRFTPKATAKRAAQRAAAGVSPAPTFKKEASC